MSRVYAFGSFDKPRFMATVDQSLRAGHRNSWGNNTCWCCAYDKGHRTARAAAQHAARLMTEEWESAPQFDERGEVVA